MAQRHAAQRHAAAQERDLGAFWLPEDTEESVLGTDLHQRVIRDLANGLEFVGLHGPLWGVGSQTRIDGFRRRDGSVVPLYPDVFVYPQPIDPQRTSHALTVDGPPLLIIEVTSESTGRGDVDERDGKVYCYGPADVAEYLVFDPTGDIVRERVRAWRKDGPAYLPWPPETDGRWYSRNLGVSFAVDGLFLRVYTAQGAPVLFNREMAAYVRELRATADKLRHELESLKHRLASFDQGDNFAEEPSSSDP